MKTIKLTIVLGVMLLSIGQVNSQERLTIINEKPGKLSKQIPYKIKNDLKGLVVSGLINGKDLLEIYKLPNLKSLDLSDVVLQDLSAIKEISASEAWRGKYVFYLPASVAYDTLKLPKYNYIVRPMISKIGKWGDERRIGHLWISPECGSEGNYTTISNLTYCLHFYQNHGHGSDLDMRRMGEVGFLELYLCRSDSGYWLAKSYETNSGLSYGGQQRLDKNIYDYPLFYAVYVPSRSVLGNKGFATLNTIMAIVEDEKDSIIVFHPFQDSILDFNQKLSFAPFAFSSNNTIYEVFLNGNTSIIPHNCFTGCFNLTKVNLAGVKSIGALAFSNTNINKVVIPASVKELDCSAFLYSKLDTIEFEGKTPPEITNWDMIYNSRRTYGDKITTNKPHWGDALGEHWKGLTIIVPDGAFQNYSVGFWKELVIITKGGKTDYEFTITEPGTLALQIDNDILRMARSIAIKGVLYDTDIEHLNKCKNLQNLDLSMCLVVKSPKTFQKEMDEMQSRAYLYQILGSMAVEQAEHEYEVGNMNLGDAMYSTVVGEYMKQLSSMIASHEIKANPSCISPEIKIKTLRQYKMPLQSSEISGFSNLSELVSVELPPDASVITSDAFYGCMKLLHVDIPNSVSYLESGAFNHCGLAEINLSETSIREYSGYSYSRRSHYSIFGPSGKDCPNLITVRLPKKAYKWYGEITYGSELYIYSIEPPEGIDLRWYRQGYSLDSKTPPRIIHVPKGYKLNYTQTDNRSTVVDDIEIDSIAKPEFVPDPDEKNLTLYSAKGDKVLIYSEGKIYLVKIDDKAIIGEIRGDKLIMQGEELAVFKGVSLYNMDGKEVANLDGTKVSFNNTTAVVNGKKICDKNTGNAMYVFNKTPNVKELLSSYVMLIIISKL